MHKPIERNIQSIKWPSKAIEIVEDAIGRNSKQTSKSNRMMQKANLNVSLLKLAERHREKYG